MTVSAARRLPADGLDRLIETLAEAGYEVWGPTVGAGAVVIDRLATAAALPHGRRTVQDGGTYRLEPTGDDRAFGCVHGADSFKRLLHPPKIRLWRCRRDAAGGLAFDADEPAADRPMAFVGVRGCDLAAIRRLDDVFARAAVPDPVYEARRAGLFVVAVECAEPGGTCFCASMETGPQVETGFDWRLTELADGDDHRFLLAAGSALGEELLATLDLPPAMDADQEARRRQGEAAVMGRELATDGLPEALVARRESGYWERVAERCLGCTNCTMVCPTCFCTTVEDTADLGRQVAERHRLWDSCYTLGFSYINGGVVREGGAARYRQWLLHKLATWWDQFDASGCVGCGRCITWCPVGIDITAEAAALRREPVP
jgi:ferredoxin